MHRACGGFGAGMRNFSSEKLGNDRPVAVAIVPNRLPRAAQADGRQPVENISVFLQFVQ
jgi:hypothetical protein